MTALASTLQACGRSTVPVPPQTASMPARLLVKPGPVPEVDRSTDPATGQETISGEQALTGIAVLYDYAGQVLGQLNALIDAEKAREPAPKPKKKRKLF